MGIKISDVEKAIEFLNSCPEELSEWKSQKVMREQFLKVAESEVFLGASGSVAERQAEAKTSQKYRDCVNELGEATGKLVYLEARERWAHTVLDLWRTLQANKRAVESIR